MTDTFAIWSTEAVRKIPLLLKSFSFQPPFTAFGQDRKKKKTPLKCYLLLFLSRSFYQDAAAGAERKINVAVNDELEDIIQEQKWGQGQEERKTSHQPAESQPEQSKTKWPWQADRLHSGVCLGAIDDLSAFDNISVVIFIGSLLKILLRNF